MNLLRVTVPEELIGQAHSREEVSIKSKMDFYSKEPSVNSYILLVNETNPKSTALVRHIGNYICKKIKQDSDLIFMGMTAKDALQTAFMDSVSRPEILVTAVIGEAGTGKTFLSCAYAFSEYSNNRKTICLSKPTTLVGESQAWGPVPGEVEDKYSPYLQSYEMIFKRLLSKEAGSYIPAMQRSGELQFYPVELMRGSEFRDCTFIAEEAQNWTWHQIKTLVSRMGENCKLILTGDLNQIDLKPGQISGLGKLVSSPAFRESPITSCVKLEAQYRSPLATLVTEVDNWVRKTS